MYLLTWTFYLILGIITVCLVKMNTIEIDRYVSLGTKKLFRFHSYLVFLFIILFFFAIVRKIDFGIGGTDAYTYFEILDGTKESFVEYIRRIKDINLFNMTEPLFVVFNILVTKLPCSHLIYLVIVYGCICFGFVKFISEFYDEKTNFFPVILMLCCYLHSYNVLRSWWSSSICLLAFCGIIKRKYVRSLILIIVAMLIHYMAICFFIVWGICFVYDKKPKLFTCRRLLYGAIIANIVAFGLREIIMTFSMSTKYSFYQDLYNTVSLLGYMPTIIITVFAILKFDYFRNMNKKMVKCVLAMFVNLSLMYVITFMLAWRINDYFAFIRMVMLSGFLMKFRGKKQEIARIILYIFVIVVFFQQMVSLKESSDVFPYLFFFM